MTVFFLPNITSMGGVARATIMLVNTLSFQKKIDVEILTLIGLKDEAAYSLNSDIKVHCLNVRNYKRDYLLLLYRLYLYFHQKKVKNLVIVETMSLLLIYPALSFIKNRPHVYVWEHFNFYNNNDKAIRSYLRKVAAKVSDKIITLTNRDKEVWKQNLNINNIEYIYNISPFQNLNTNYNIYSKTILAVGRFVSVKGFDRLIIIWSKLLKTYNIEGWQLKIVGGGPLHINLQQQINQLNLSDSVSLIDNVNNVQSYYKEAAFLCMTSLFEGLPMVLIEAQSFGLPIIAYDCYTGPSEIIDDKSGFLIEDNNEKLFIDSIYKLIINPNIRVQFSEQSEKLSKRFDENIIADKWIEMLK